MCLYFLDCSPPMVLLGSLTAFARADVPPNGLSDSEILALVAGSALPENIVNQIQLRGLAFPPSNEYRSLLKRAGAAAPVLAALDSAKVTSFAESSQNKQDAEFLQHLAQAADLMRNKRYTDAARELNRALALGPNNADVGFVMGELLRRQEQFMAAASVYREVLSKDPEFSEAHTKLAYTLYRVGDEEQAITEAKSALRRTPQNAEAHKNMGLAFEATRKYDAAVSEYHEALRIKPDDGVVHYDLGILFYEQRDRKSVV